MNRRQFLGAAAALAALPATAPEASAETEASGRDEADSPYGRRSILRTAGGVEVFTPDADDGTEVAVWRHPEGISLRLESSFGVADVLLLPEDVDALCRELIEAKAVTREEDVEAAREWICEGYRS